MTTDRFTRAIAAMDAANAQDPNLENEDGRPVPAELLYSRRMTQTLEAFCPEAPEHVKLAARAQHIRRWEIPRDTFPMDRKGYHLWRTRLYGYHAEIASEILRSAGYDDEMIVRVADLLQKKRIKSDPDMQTLEDVICLTFLRWYYGDFIADHDDEKVITILRRTWNKMSDRGHEAALRLPLSGRGLDLVKRALAGEPAEKGNA